MSQPDPIQTGDSESLDDEDLQGAFMLHACSAITFAALTLASLAVVLVFVGLTDRIPYHVSVVGLGFGAVALWYAMRQRESAPANQKRHLLLAMIAMLVVAWAAKSGSLAQLAAWLTTPAAQVQASSPQ